MSPPIAIVGRACVLPGALNPEQLWQAIATGRDLITSVPAGRWRIDHKVGLGTPENPDPDRAWSDRGGYVQGFDAIWNPQGFGIDATELEGLAPLVAWALHCAREARDACNMNPQQRVGAVFGNLGFPSERMAAYAEHVWRGGDVDNPVDARNRYMSAGTAELLQRALSLDAGSFCIDAACASGLYAIKLACDQLHAGTADVMLAGAVQGADDLFLHVGFSALNALSRSGQSRPFHADADGLVPAEGAAFVALKRLSDARRDGDVIHGVIRGIGLSNDGRGKGLLAPSEAGQQRAMRAAYAAAGIDPKQVGLLECHATGTPVGDATELASSTAVFAANEGLAIGSLKSNLGHLITAAGVAGLLKLLAAMQAQQRPPTLHANMPNAALKGSPFRLLHSLEAWPSQSPRIAAISAFGFGGNNAHLIVSEDDPALAHFDTPLPSTSIAIVGIGAMLGEAHSRDEVRELLFNGGDGLPATAETRMREVAVDVDGLRFPPLDMQQTLPQQLAILQTSREALAEVAPVDGERCGVFIGMEPDPEVARYGARWRLPADATTAARDAIVPALTSAAVLGCMPNIPANRLSSLLDLRGPSFTVQSGRASGIAALRIAATALARGEIDSALVGAVDFSCEVVQRSASTTLGADAAFSVVLKRLNDVLADGEQVYAWFDSASLEGSQDGVATSDEHAIGDAEGSVNLCKRFGTAFAAHGMLHVVAAALCLQNRCDVDGRPRLDAAAPNIVVRMQGDEPFEFHPSPAGVSGCARGPLVRAPENAPAPFAGAGVRGNLSGFRCFSGINKQAVIAALQSGIETLAGPARLVLVTTDAQFEDTCARALAHLERGTPAGNGVHFHEQPIVGEIAFVFAGAGASYHGMGRALLQHVPSLIDRLAERSKRLPTALAWAFDASMQTPSALQQLWGASALSQLHLHLSQDLLGLQADAWLGYSSGETNALVASGTWTDTDALMDEMEISGLVTHELGGEFAAIERVWRQPVHWASWTVLAPIADVEAAIGEWQRVHIAIINSDEDCLIAGDADQCAAVVAKIGERRCLRLDYPLAVHVPELAEVADAWLNLHRRRTTTPTGRLYSNALGHAYVPDSESCARAILAQADQRLDLRPAVLAAWNDGVRVFVEHGPGGAYGRAIRNILGERECLVVSLDRKGQGIDATLNAVAALLAAGVPLNHEVFESPRPYGKGRRPRWQRFPAHPPAIVWPQTHSAAPVFGSACNDFASMPISNDSSFPRRRESSQPAIDTIAETHRIPAHAGMTSVQVMLPAPPLPSVLVWTDALPPVVAQSTSRTAEAVSVRNDTRANEGELGAHPLLQTYQAQFGQLAEAQRTFIEHQAALQQRYLGFRQRSLQQLLAKHELFAQTAPLMEGAAPAAPRLAPPHRDSQSNHVKSSRAGARPSNTALQTADDGLSHPLRSGAASALTSPRLPLSRSAQPTGAGGMSMQRSVASADIRFTRQDLETHASGRIADLFGPAFAHQDSYHRQVRMPMPPLLLADRVMSLDAEPDSMGTGVICTETDVRWDGWYLHQGYMPAGVLIEAGQADLMLISWLGVDRFNQGERVYRLLGCELTYHGDLPRAGETVNFSITLDGHAAQGDVRLMFFHYDCFNGERAQLSVRKGQAGFFSDRELAESAGCLWTPETQAIVANPRLDPPRVERVPTAINREALHLLARGDAFGALGAGFEFTQTHTRTPTLQPGAMLLLDRVTDLKADGGPWGRGHLRAELDIDSTQWFFAGHFKNDPCMPGTLMFEACLQAMAVYLIAHGHSIQRDGWRFQPVPELPYQLQCRGQVTPSSKLLVTELFIEELHDGPIPSVYADLLCTVDGLKAFHARRVAVQMVPDWPLSGMPHVVAEAGLDQRPSALVDGFAFDQKSLLACAYGRPSHAFGPMYHRFDGAQRVARLPSPPYLFISRIREVEGAQGVMGAGARVIADYDIPADAWYFDRNGCRSMPFAVLLEAALQPCGWLSSYVGSALTQADELGFRNLDGEGELLAELFADSGMLSTEVTLTDVSATGGMIIENFNVICRLGEREVYRLKTVFGFFPPAALANQAGLRRDADALELLQRASNVVVDLTITPADHFDANRPRLANDMLLMLDRIDGHWPDAGKAGLGQVRAVKDIDHSAWFFKAHFFQDPVQPGSLGLEAMLQALQFHMLQTGMDRGIAQPRFEPIALARTHRWKYRGQVLPKHRTVHTTLEITEIGEDERGTYALADASLWADGQRIYEMIGVGMRIVSAQES
ncbi:MAG: beta-ketoacyl synthase N-terminal-like domain-containing protein [Pseudomarimonas sp.]